MRLTFLTLRASELKILILRHSEIKTIIFNLKYSIKDSFLKIEHLKLNKFKKMIKIRNKLCNKLSKRTLILILNVSFLMEC